MIEKYMFYNLTAINNLHLHSKNFDKKLYKTLLHGGKSRLKYLLKKYKLARILFINLDSTKYG